MKRILLLIVCIAIGMNAGVALAQHEHTPGQEKMPGHDNMPGGSEKMPDGDHAKHDKKKGAADKKKGATDKKQPPMSDDKKHAGHAQP